MKRPNQIAGAVLVLVAAIVARESLTLEYFTDIGPGPGFFPFWLSVLLASSGACILYQATFQASLPMPADFIPTGAGFLRVGAIVLAVMAVVVLMVPLGFRLTVLGFQFFLLITLGRQSLPVTILVSLAGSFGLYEVFSNFLELPLPVGGFGI